MLSVAVAKSNILYWIEPPFCHAAMTLYFEPLVHSRVSRRFRIGLDVFACKTLGATTNDPSDTFCTA